MITQDARLRMQGRHKSLDKHLKHSIRWLESISGVTKVVLGISESCRHKFTPGTLRFKMDVAGGIKINAYSGNGVMDVFVKIDPITEREAVKEKIKSRYL